MRRQDLHDMDVVVSSEEELELQIGKEMHGIGVIVDPTTFQFVVKQATDHSHHNPIIYKGRVLTCRLRKDGRYAVSFFINPDGDLEERLKRVVYETKASFRAVAEDSITREVCHEV